MQIYKKEHEFIRGKAIIVGKRSGNIVGTDGVIIDTATTLSDNPRVLENANITDEDKIIYICGHGNLEKQTIGKRSMAEIAKLLIEQGYTGIQDIYITSCESATEYKDGSTMAEDLKSHLRSRLKDIDNMRINVESKSDGQAVVTTSADGEIELYVLRENTTLGSLYLTLKSIKQHNELRKLRANNLKIDIDNCERDIEKHRKSIGDKIRTYKRRLIVSEVISRGDMVAFKYLSLIVRVLVMVIVAGVFMNTNIIESNKLLSLLSILMIVVSEIIETTIVAKGDYYKTITMLANMFICGLGSGYILYVLMS